MLPKENQLLSQGSNDENIQLVVNAINQLLGNYGNTISWDNPLLTRQGRDEKMNSLISELETGQISALLVWGVNPVFDHPKGKTIEEAIKKLPLSVSFPERKDETAKVCRYILPEPNYLESWGDFEPKGGILCLSQPTIAPLFDSRPVQETLLKWSDETISYKEYLQEFWQTNYFPQQNEFTDYQMFWNDSLQKGVFSISKKNEPRYSQTGLAEAAQKIPSAKNGIEIALYESIAIGNGKYGNNPWLQELPDPIAKISWDNFAAVPVVYAEENGLNNEDIISINGVELPVFIQPGQAKNTISIALGYGRAHAGKVGEETGKDVYPWVRLINGTRCYYVENANVSK